MVTYVDDGYIKAKLSVALQVLAELKSVFKTDAGLDLNVSKTSIVHKGVTVQDVFDMVQTIIQSTPSLVHLVTTFSSIPSNLKVSLSLVCLLRLMPLYGVLWLKHVGIS